MFGMLKEALETLGKELSAAYFMSDFELAIRDAFTETFQGIEAKGCAFHYSKAVLSKVARSGFKGDYQSSPEFACLVRAIFGLAYVPLARLAEAVRNLYILAKKLDDRQAKFAVGSFPPPSRPPSRPETPVSGQFRRVIMAQKRKSDLTYSVAGADLRTKRRRRLEAVSTIDDAWNGRY